VWRSFVFTALFRPTSLHVFVNCVTHRAVLFASGSASRFAFVDVSNQTVFGHVVSKIFFKFDAKYVRIFVLSLEKRYHSFLALPHCGGLFYDRLDFFPEHFHFARDRRRGEFGSFAALGCFFI